MSQESLPSLARLRNELRETSRKTACRAQIEEITKKDSSNGKPYWEVRLRDESDTLTLRAWSDTPAFLACGLLECGDCVEVQGEFYHNGSFGPDARRWEIHKLDEEQAATLFEGTGESRLALEEDFSFVVGTISNLDDPRLRRLGQIFLEEYGDRFRRAAAARNYHHARRGGLCQHTAQMMRTAIALCGVYPRLNRDLLLAGVLFHDSGKLWETCPGEREFGIGRELVGEMLGHITIGIELVNRLWIRLEPERNQWQKLQPSSETVRLHLLHLIAAHHGETQFGSPVVPKTPEAIALHHIDNLDAKMEMTATSYERSPELAPGIFDRMRPLPVGLIAPLAHFERHHGPHDPGHA
jgi:3'-5' exoribonuclease